MTGARLEHDWFDMALPPNVTIGERSWLYSSFAFLHFRSTRPDAVRIGHDTGVYDGTMFDLGPSGEVVVGDWSTIVYAVISTNGRVGIGDYTFVAHDVHLVDSDWARPDRGDAPSPPIDIGDDVWIGARATIFAGARVGNGAIVGAGAIVRDDVPAGRVVVGNPARVVR